MYKLLFFLQNLLDKLLVVIAELVDISSVLAFQLSFSLDFVFESKDFDCLLRLRLTLSGSPPSR